MLKPPAAPTCGRLILELLTAIPQHTAPAAVLIRGAAVFGFDDNAVRVALTRLRQRGLIASVERGIYRIGPSAEQTTGWIVTWRDRASWLAPWDGTWLALSVDLSDLTRTDQMHLQRWLQLRGFQATSRALFLRPANLDRPWERLGAPPMPALTGHFDVHGALPEQTLTHWRSGPWNAQMRRALERLRQARQSMADRSLEEAARLSFLTGSDAIAAIVREPLLPEPWTDAALRQQLIQEMTAFDELGKRLWFRIMFPDSTTASTCKGEDP